VIGDILLVMHPSSTVSAANVRLQRVVSPGSKHAGPGGFSHVAIGSGPGQIFHAMPAPAHVEFALVHEVLDPGTVFQAFRNKHLAGRVGSDPGLYGSLRWEFSKHIGGAYNFTLSLRDDPDLAFCSQLVGRIAESLGNAFPKSARWLFPNDIAAYVQAHEHEWECVTDEYKTFIANSADYKRLWANRNSVDAKAFRVAYERAKRHANEFERAFAAMEFGERPQTRLPILRHGGLTEISQTIEAPPAQREPNAPPSNLFSYRQSVRAWDKHFDMAATQLSEEQYQDIVSLDIPGRPLPAEDPRISPSCKSHDAVLVLADERTAKLAALMFDSVIPLGTDRIPEEVCAWDAPRTWRRGSAEILAAVAKRKSRPGHLVVRVKGNDGSVASLDSRDPLGAEEANAALITQLFLSEPVFFDRVHAALQNSDAVGCPVAVASIMDFSAAGGPNAVREDCTLAIAIQGAEVIDVEELSWDDVLHIRTETEEFDALRSFRNVFDKALLSKASALSQSAVGFARRQSLAAAKALRLPTRKVSFAVLFDGNGPLASSMNATIQMALANLATDEVHDAGEGGRLAIAVVPGSLLSVAERFGLLYLIDWSSA
jgi:hypothetical protein